MGNVIQFAKDTLRNFLSGMGTARDKASGAVYCLTPMTDMELSNTYRSAWLARKVIDIPAKDSIRAWRNWQAKQDQILKLEAEEKRLDLQAKILEARIKARLFGGAALYLGTGDKDPTKPLDPSTLAKGGLKYVVVMSRVDFTAYEIEYDPTSPNYMKAKQYQIQSPEAGQVLIHPSRLVIFNGAKLPDIRILPTGYYLGWGESVLQAGIDAIKNADSTAGNIASLIFEAKVDVVKVPHMMDSMGDPEYRQRLQDRFSLAMAGKGISGTLMLDMDEEYDQKTPNFANLDKITVIFLQMVAGAFDIPLTRLLGQSPGGMNSTGDHDTENYNKMIASEQRIEMTPAMYVMDECLIRSALGNRPSAVTYEWAPLDEISEKDLTEMGQIQASSVVALAATDVLPLQVLSEAYINQASETGTMPGLDAMMSEFLKKNPTYYTDLEQQKAAAAKAALTAPTAPGAKKPTVPTPAKTAPAASGFNK